jgi:hypothetical protein
MERIEDEQIDDRLNENLQEEFEKLSYREIEKVLDVLGIKFVDSIESVSKQEIYSITERDCSPDEIKEAMEKVKL